MKTNKNRNNGWISCSVQPTGDLVSTSMIQIPLLVTVPRFYKYPVIGYFFLFGNTEPEWRISGSPSSFNGEVGHWRKMPKIPKTT
jgi:hypothetical protein